MTAWLTMAMAVALCSCHKDGTGTPLQPEGRIDIVFSLSSPSSVSATKADTEELGDDELNENAINRLDLYVFESTADEASCTKHVYYDASPASSTTGYGSLSKGDDGSSWTWSETGLYYSGDELKGKTVYLIANWAAASTASIASLSDLKAATIADGYFSPKKEQTSFVMDGNLQGLNVKSNSNQDGNVTSSTTDGTTTYTLAMDLARALSKIRLQVTSEGIDITVSEDLEYSLYNYASDASVTADGTDISSTTELKQQGVVGDDALKQTVAGVYKAVFYSYPNDWYDSSKDAKQEEPIASSRQTYVMLHAPFEGHPYWYKVPLNRRLQEDGDDAGATVDANLYRLQRNHIYDVTVTIDRIGGTLTDPVTLENVKYQAMAWDDRTSDTITFN